MSLIQRAELGIFQKNETPKMPDSYIKEYGLDSYNSLMGIEHNENGTKLDDHSSTVNLGLINMESKSETDTRYEYSGLTVKEYIEIGLAILIVIGAARAIYRYLKKKKTKSSNKKKNQLKEIVVEATGSTQGMVLKPFKQTMPMQQRIQTATMSPNQQQKVDNQIVPLNMERENQIVTINLARFRLFLNTLYD